MRRRLFNLASAISLMLCPAVAALWLRAQFASDRPMFHAGPHAVQAWTIKTCFYVRCSTPPYHADGFKSKPAFDGWSYSSFLHPRAIDYSDVSGHPHEYMWLGFSVLPTYRQPGWVGGSLPRPDTWFTQVGMPFYGTFALTAVLPVLRFRQWLTDRRRRRLNLCPACGYDVRATPVRCPECGEQIVKADRGVQPL